MIIVLCTKGKHETVDYASVRIFDSKIAAHTFIDKYKKPGKYWQVAEMVTDGEEVGLYNPFTD